MDSVPPARFGDLLRRYRLAAGLTQEELAERARLSPHAVSDLERGARNRPWRETILLLAEALQLGAPERARLEAAARRVGAPAPGAADGSAEPAAPPRPRTNLPASLTSFVGRKREIAEVNRLIATTRFLTLTGTGGCGKTRLALEVGAALVDGFVDGVWFVDLAPLADSSLVPQAVAAALGVHDVPGRDLLRTVTEHLRSRDLLLILDNCEHLLDACAQLAEALLRSCPHVRILATSRELLGLAGETAWRVPSLTLPDPRQPVSTNRLARYEATQLFLERARAVLPSFALTSENASAVAQICGRLDGIPLALELAAARVRVLTVEQIAARLDDRFSLLTGGSRTALRRQQTLQVAIDWSYQLLTEGERALLRRLAVFAGGWSLEAAEAVDADARNGGPGSEVGDASPFPRRDGGQGVRSAADILDRLTGLVDKSLVVAEGQGATERYRLLETIRQYAEKKLVDAGEADPVRARHRDWYLGLAEQALPGLEGHDLKRWADRLEDEHDNLRAALAWSAAHPGDAPALLRLAGLLGRFWRIRGHIREAIRWLERAVAGGAATPRPDRARGLGWLGYFAWIGGELDRAGPLLEESVAQARAVGEGKVLAESLRQLSYVAMDRGDRARARQLLEEAVGVSRATGYRREMAFSLLDLAKLLAPGNGLDRTEALLVETRSLAQESGDPIMVCGPLMALCWVQTRRGELGQARRTLEECLAIAQREDARWPIMFTRLSLGELATMEENLAEANAEYRQVLAVVLDVHRGVAGYALYRYAALCAARGDHRRAARLLGAVSAAPPRGDDFDLLPHPDVEAEAEAARQVLGPSEFAAAWAEGQALTLEQAVEYALTEDSAADSPSGGL